jgi:hypothetical protein
LKQSSPQKRRGRHGSLIHTSVVKISISGLNARVQWERNNPLEPMKYGPDLKNKSPSSIVSKMKTKKPVPQ